MFLSLSDVDSSAEKALKVKDSSPNQVVASHESVSVEKAKKVLFTPQENLQVSISLSLTLPHASEYCFCGTFVPVHILALLQPSVYGIQEISENGFGDRTPDQLIIIAIRSTPASLQQLIQLTLKSW